MARSTMKARIAVLGLAALTVGGCSKKGGASPGVPVADTTAATNQDAQPTGAMNAFNAYPDPDKELVTDYGRLRTDPLRQFFRIHMDIPISDSSDFRDLRVALDRNKEADAYGIVQRIIKKLPMTEPARRKRGQALVDAALKPMPK